MVAVDGTAQHVFQHSRIDAGDILTRAWAIFKVHWAMVLLVVVVAMILTMAISYTFVGITLVLEMVLNHQMATIILQVAQNVITQAVSLWLALGMKLYLLRTARGEDARFSMLFAGGRYFWSALVAMVVLLVGLTGVMAACMLPGLLVLLIVGTDSPATFIVMVAGMLVALPILLMATIVFSQFQYLCVDREAGPIEALSLSYQITAGNRLSIVLVWLITMAINMLGMLACCVGVIAAWPLVTLIYTVQYLAMTGQPTVDQHWNAAAAQAPTTAPPPTPPPDFA